MIVRDVTPRDFIALTDMMQLMREESPVLKDVKVDVRRTIQFMETMYANKQLIGVMTEHGCMLGMIGANWYSDRVDAFEQMLYVKPEYRRSILAGELLYAFENRCRAAGAEWLHVGSSTGINDERVAKFYRRAGYSDAGISLRRKLV